MQHNSGQFLIQHLCSLIAAGDGIDSSVDFLYDLHFRNQPGARIFNDNVTIRVNAVVAAVLTIWKRIMFCVKANSALLVNRRWCVLTSEVLVVSRHNN